MDKLEHPIFYNAPNGMRFEIGGSEPIYLDTSSEELISNPAYIDAAFERAESIYRGLPHEPNLLRIDGYPDEKSTQEIIDDICKLTMITANSRATSPPPKVKPPSFEGTTYGFSENKNF
jgi:hypothetical protein